MWGREGGKQEGVLRRAGFSAYGTNSTEPPSSPNPHASTSASAELRAVPLGGGNGEERHDQIKEHQWTASRITSPGSTARYLC